MIYAVAEEGEIAEYGVVREDFAQSVGDFACSANIGGTSCSESYRASHIKNVCIKRDDEVGRVYGAPDTEIDYAVAPYHPSQEEP